MEYTNSPLVSYTNISSHKHCPRAFMIDRITPHCIVGQTSARWCVDYFATTDREVSSNYVIGKDGEVGMSVEERDRSWCSSSPENDHRAVTIECASDREHPYTMNDKVFETLINLCVDICKRNGKNKVVWIDDKAKALAYQQKPNEMLFTVHRWFAATACPGDWLYSRMGKLAEEVNKRLATSVAATNPKPKSDDVAPWAKEAHRWVVENGISDGTRPSDTVTREEAWTMLYRLYNAIKGA